MKDFPSLQLEHKHLVEVQKLIQKHVPNASAVAYGSRVKGKATRTSDLDIVLLCPNSDRAFVGDLREAFEESDLPFIVDLQVWEDLPADFQNEIRAEHCFLTLNEATLDPSFRQ